MTRELTGFKFTPANEPLNITVMDAPAIGGGNNYYTITGMSYEANPVAGGTNIPIEMIDTAHILFHNGPVTNGANGITDQTLLAILIDRFKGFQSGPFKCEESAQTLYHLEWAMKWMERRTKERVSRGVEGKQEK